MTRTTHHCITLICCFQYKHVKTLQKWQILLLFLTNTVITTNISGMTLPKVEEVLSYIESEPSNPRVKTMDSLRNLGFNQKIALF